MLVISIIDYERKRDWRTASQTLVRRASHRGSRVAAESRLKEAYDGLANPCQGALRPRYGPNAVGHITALPIDGHLEQLLSALGVIRERSVRESECILAVEPADLVKDSSAVQRPEP